jgi:site-specific DNA-methyltransferase (adenine-specific)
MNEPYYSDEHVQLWHGDCLELTAWLEADVLVTDPPYGISWVKGENRRAKSRRHTGIVNDTDTSARDAAITAMTGKPGAIFGSLYAPFPCGLKQALIYRKPADAGVVGSTTGWRRDVEVIFLVGPWPHRNALWSSVLTSRIANAGTANSPAGRTGHPHAKPMDLMEILLEGCPPGSIADPFAGSGPTLIAARNLGRKAIGVEIDERYCELIARRLDQNAFTFGEAS